MAAAGWRTFNRVMAEAVAQAGSVPCGEWQARILRLHDVPAAGPLRHGLHVHSWFELSVVAAGEVAYRVGDQERVIGPGGVFAMPPGHEHGWRLGSGRALITGFQVAFSPPAGGGAQLDAWYRRIVDGGWSLPAHPLAGALVDELHALAGGSDAGREGVGLLVRTLLVWLCGRLGQGSGRRRAPDLVGADRLERLRAHVVEHLTEDLPLAALARRMGVSPRHLNRLFVQANGVPLHRFILLQRLERASQALVWSDLPIAAVAAGAGFRDPDYFCRLFRRHYGLTAERWRARELGVHGQ